MINYCIITNHIHNFPFDVVYVTHLVSVKYWMQYILDIY